MPALETNTRKIVARLEREGWVSMGGKRHEVFRHPRKSGRAVVPRHREVSPFVAREIAKSAGGFFFVWTLWALGGLGGFTVILSARGLWDLRRRRPQ